MFRIYLTKVNINQYYSNEYLNNNNFPIHPYAYEKICI